MFRIAELPMKIILKCFFVILIVVFNAHSQVIINERIEIEPKIPEKLLDIKGAMAGDNTVTIIFINEDTSPVDTIRMQLEDCFGEVIHESSSSNTVSYTFEQTNASKFEYIIY